VFDADNSIAGDDSSLLLMMNLVRLVASRLALSCFYLLPHS
jgi:hypothetical protein